MRRIGRIAAACAATIVALACQSHASQDIPEIRRAARAAAANDWALLGIDERAKVRFPVRHQSDDETASDGAPARVFTAWRGGVHYSVAVMLLSESYARSAEDDLEAVLKAYAADVSGELVLARPIVLAGCRGREFEIVSRGGLVRGRIVLAGDRAYMLHVFFGGEVSPGEHAEIDRFLGSLEIGGRPPRRIGYNQGRPGLAPGTRLLAGPRRSHARPPAARIESAPVVNTSRSGAETDTSSVPPDTR